MPFINSAVLIARLCQSSVSSVEAAVSRSPAIAPLIFPETSPHDILSNQLLIAVPIPLPRFLKSNSSIVVLSVSVSIFHFAENVSPTPVQSRFDTVLLSDVAISEPISPHFTLSTKLFIEPVIVSKPSATVLPTSSQSIPLNNCLNDCAMPSDIL